MTADEARRWLITATLILTTATFMFFIIAPVLGYPMLWPDAIRIFEIVLPVFLGYLGTATQFVFQNMARKHGVRLFWPVSPQPYFLEIVFSLRAATVTANPGLENHKAN